jgi:hypothetical protein
MASSAFFRAMPISSGRESCDMKTVVSRGLTWLRNLETMPCHCSRNERSLAEEAPRCFDLGRVAFVLRVIAIMGYP